MIAAVFDSNVIVSGLIWRGESYLCLVAQARRGVQVFASDWIVDEVRRSIKEIEKEEQIAGDPWPGFHWFVSATIIIEPAPTGKQRSRDAKDDPILGTALAARATIIVTKDGDLLALGKPFGIETLHPSDFLRRLRR